MKKSSVRRLLLLFFLAAAVLVGCGDGKDSGSKKDEEYREPEIVRGSAGEMLEAMLKVPEGEAEFAVTGDRSDISFRFSYEPGRKFTFSIKAEERGESVDMEILRSTGDDVYVNLGALTGYVGIRGRAATEGAAEAWLRLPLPDDYPKSSESGLMNLFDGMSGRLDTALTKIETRTVSDGDCEYTLRTKADYEALLTALEEFVKQDFPKNIEKFEKPENEATEIDLNRYVAKLLDIYEDEILEVCEEYGSQLGVSQKKAKEFLTELRSQDINALLKEYRARSGQMTQTADPEAALRELAQYVEKAGEALDDMVEKGGTLSFRVTADEDSGYRVQVRAKDGTGKAGEDITFRLTPKNVSVEAPKSEGGLKAFAEMMFGRGSSYDRYTERANEARDQSELADMMVAAEHVAVDPEFDVPTGAEFRIIVGDGKIRREIPAVDGWGKRSETLDCWYEIAPGDELRSSALEDAEACFVGVLQSNGDLKWSCISANSEMKELLDSSNWSDFVNRYLPGRK